VYLARGTLNPASRDVQRDLADPAELHRTVMRLFPDQAGERPREMLGVLHRVDTDVRRGAVVLFVQSRLPPEFARLADQYLADLHDDLDLALAGDEGNPRVRSIAAELDAIAVGQRFAFRLRANTTRNIMTKSLPDGTKQNGKRVPVRGDEERQRWLARHAERGGFRVEDVRVAELPPTRSRGKGRSMTFQGALFEGVLAVNDAGAFRETMAAGIGPAKAFGFGLLSTHRQLR